MRLLTSNTETMRICRSYFNFTLHSVIWAKRVAIFSEREREFTFAKKWRRPSVCRLSVCVVCRLSSVCKVRAPYSDDWNFRQCFTPFGTLDIY